MIEFVTGDFFDYKADIRINTVNCVGVMGAGVALEFKNKYPEMFRAYVDVCKRKEIAPGKPFLWEEYDLFSRCIIINLPTKLHWRNPSEYDYIERDLIWLRNFLRDKNEKTVVTLPALGCGHGGLNWGIVKDKIIHYLGDLPAKILVFEPSSSNKELNKIQYNARIQENNVVTIYPEEKEYPSNLKGRNKKEIYCKGNVKLLNYKRLSIILGNSINEKEMSAVFRTLEELNNEQLVIVVGLNNKKQLEVAKSLLEKGYKLMLVIPYGILQFKFSYELEKYITEYVIISFLQPLEEFKKYEYINSLKKRLDLANAILYCSEDLEGIRKSVKYLKGYDNLFYINFWLNDVKEFNELKAKKVSISAVTKKPNVVVMQKTLDMQI